MVRTRAYDACNPCNTGVYNRDVSGRRNRNFLIGIAAMSTTLKGESSGKENRHYYGSVQPLV